MPEWVVKVRVGSVLDTAVLAGALGATGAASATGADSFSPLFLTVSTAASCGVGAFTGAAGANAMTWDSSKTSRKRLTLSIPASASKLH